MMKKKMLGIAAILCIAMASATYAVNKNTMDISGEKRSYLVYRPVSLAPDAHPPLVIMLHGGFGSGEQAEKAYRWDKAAEAHGFIVAYPDGIHRSWNAGGTCCGKARTTNADDLKFLTEIIHDLIKRENVDPHRVYLTGMSNGAAMSYRYACEGEYPVAAIGVVSGSLSTTCQKPHTISVMEIHGTDDKNIPLAGGVGSKGVSKVNWLPVEKTLSYFQKISNCQAFSETQDGAVKTSTSHCDKGNEVILIKVGGAGHQWPGSKKVGFLARNVLPIDPPSNALDATSVLWNFFQSHPAVQ